MNCFDRFFKKVEKSPTGCWLWLSVIDDSGYGGFWFIKKWRKAHRVSWELFKGPIPEGLQVLHKCDVRNCVNPEHLFLGTNYDNSRDCFNKHRHARGSRAGPAKLTEEQVRKIRKDHRSGPEIAFAYQISNSTVGGIRRREIWRHLSD